jgi:serine/threonine-protein kinase
MIEWGVSFDGYRVERALGRGGMGVVYEAVQSSLDRRVALKVLRPELAEDPGYADRLRREGRLQASLEHPHVLDVYEVGESPAGLFLAMRLVEGPTLSDLLREGGLDAERAIELLDQVAGALDAAHRVGLVHRDVKPQNILVDDDDHAFLADFGLSHGGAEPETTTRPVIGTVAYVAPEVVRGQEPGPASDVYAFAATMFHCLSGDVPFPRGSDAAILYAHANDGPPRISERRAELPAALDAIFARALAKDPAERPASASALVAEVRRALGDRVTELGAPDVGGWRAPELDAALPRRGSDARRPRRVGVAAAIAVAVLAAATGAAAVALLDDEAEPVAGLPVPEVPAGAEALGSELGPPSASLDCRGGEPEPDSTPCAIAQTALPGAQLLVPADGKITAWTVRGASGEVALDVIRARGEDTARVARSQWETVGNDAPHRFTADLPVERGDLLALELGPGASVGVAETEGATTDRWFEPTGGAYGSADRSSGSGYDFELLLRADFVAGAEQTKPEKLTGKEAAAAPDGRVRERVEVEISKPRATVDVELVEVGGRVALDMYRGERRIERIFVPDLLPGGQPVDLKVYTYEGEEFSEIDVWWVNPNSGRMVFHFFNASERHIDFVG